jgi:myosin III
MRSFPFFSFPQILGKRVIYDEFRSLPDRLPTEAEMPPNSVPLNRYKNILPTMATRVKVQLLKDRDGAPIPNSDYINANWITGYRGKKYIAAQAPTDAMCESFWRMIWEKKVALVLMTSNLIEGNKRKCAEYWPTTSAPMQYPSGLIIKAVKVDRQVDYLVTTLTVSLRDEERKVTHVMVTSFPDHGVPSSLESFGRIVDLWRQLNFETRMSPMLTHCSAGVGRTGSVLGLDIALDMLLDQKPVNLLRIIDDMRKQRGNMVQTYKQYIFMLAMLAYFVYRDDMAGMHTQAHKPHRVHAAWNPLQARMGSTTTAGKKNNSARRPPKEEAVLMASVERALRLVGK